MATKKSPGRPRKHPETQSFSIRLPKDLHRQLRLYAVHQGQSLNDLIIGVLQGWWDDHPERRAFVRLASRRE
ncbi:MAG TPA: toxin-antitoxin system HicB family antitoxin [Polyangiaceae bacterium]|nr:toxin-antitoxin system HicB family antitoxin [Polyangiaceae bacterium]